LFDALTDGRSKRPIDPPDETYSPGLVRLAPLRSATPPTILYPVPGSEIYAGAFGGDGVVFAASGGEGDYRWYVDGQEVTRDPEAGRTIWRPSQTGFYDVAVVDRQGLSASAKVRVAAIE